MPKKVSKKKTTKRPKKVSRKKSKRVTKRKPKRVTKRKPKYKRRKRRFGSSSFHEGLQSYLRGTGGSSSDKTNAIFKKLRSGVKPTKSVSYKDVFERLRGTKGIQALYNTFSDNKAFTKIGNNTEEAILKRHKAFHTVLVAIISAILQLINKVGTVQKSNVFDRQRQDVKFLPIFSKRQTYSESGLQKYVNLPEEQTRITDFNIVERNGVVTGFTHKFRNQLFEVSIFGRQQGSNVFIDTLFTNLASRLPAVEDSKASGSEDGREFLRVASAYDAAFSTVVNMDTGDIASFQVDQLASDLGTMSINNNNNNIVTNVEDVNNTLKTFENPSTTETKAGLKSLSNEIGSSVDTGDLLDFTSMETTMPVMSQTQPVTSDDVNLLDFDNFETTTSNESIDGKSLLMDGTPPPKDDKDDYLSEFMPAEYKFGRRKRKRKVSKKKGPSAALKKLCKKLKVKLTTKRRGKRVYKSEKVLKSQCKKAAKKSSFGKKPTKIPSALKKKCKRYNIRLTTGKKRVPKTLKKLKKDLDDKLKKIKIRKQKGRANLIKKAPFYAKKYAKYRAKRSLVTRATGALLRSVAKGRPSLFGKNRDIEAVKKTKCKKIKGCNGNPRCCKRVKKALINMYQGKATKADKKLIVDKKHFVKSDVDFINYCWNPKNKLKCRGAGIAAAGAVGGLSGLLLSRSLKKKNKIDMSKMPKVDSTLGRITKVNFGKKKKRRRKRTSK